MAKITVDVEALSANSSVLSSIIKKLIELNTSLENLIGRIETSWEGQSSARYISTIRSHAEQARKMASVLDE